MEKSQLIREFSRKVSDGRAGLFVGAGLSRPAGFVDWRGLMRELAEDVGLEVDKESDLVSLAQYHLNERGNRAKINETLLHEFVKHATPTLNHRLIARLPISLIWTTNYDSLIEDSLAEANRRVDVKRNPDSMAVQLPGSDVVVVKMHGDVSSPTEAVLTKDDYESYGTKREIFSIRLRGDLISNSFLFLGFSFTDPNIDYILSRVRLLLGGHTPNHYCVMARPRRPDPETPEKLAEYDYDTRKLQLRINDLKRFGIQTVLVDSYDEISEILEGVNGAVARKNIFVSGASAVESPEFSLVRIGQLSRAIGSLIIEMGGSLVSGYGVGVGAEVVTGALEAAYVSRASVRDRLRLWPFPRAVTPERKREVNRDWRRGMLRDAGVAIFIAGSKISDEGVVRTSSGVLEEYSILVEDKFRCLPIPIGATGWAAQHIYEEASGIRDSIFGELTHATTEAWQIIGESTSSNDEIVRAVRSIIQVSWDKVG